MYIPRATHNPRMRIARKGHFGKRDWCYSWVTGQCEHRSSDLEFRQFELCCLCRRIAHQIQVLLHMLSNICVEVCKLLQGSLGAVLLRVLIPPSYARSCSQVLGTAESS